MALVDSILVFVISFLVGTVGIYIGARVMTDVESFEKAAITAIIGAVVWTIFAILFGWIPLLGPLLALIAYVGVVNWQYPSGWGTAAGIALIAWVASIVILYVLAVVGLVGFDALGVPGA